MPGAAAPQHPRLIVEAARFEQSRSRTINTMDEDSAKRANGQPMPTGDSARTQGRDPQDVEQEEIDDDLHSHIQYLEERVANSRIVKELVKAFKEVLTSPNAPKLAEAIGSQIVKTREAEAQARASAAKSYGTSAIVANVVFILSMVLCLIFLGWVIHTLKGDKDLLLPVLSAVISLIAGAGGGYVFGRQSVAKK